MTSNDIALYLERLATAKDSLREELNAADRKIGDGDTGMTVADIVASWDAIRARLPTDVGEALLLLGREAGRATGSSLGSVLALGLAAAGREARGNVEMDRGELIALLQRATTAITDRSGAMPGDKTILDSLLGIQLALAQSPTENDLLQTAVNAAQEALDRFRDQEARLGRARMYGAKTRGLDDPGMLAARLLLAAAQAR